MFEFEPITIALDVWGRAATALEIFGIKGDGAVAVTALSVLILAFLGICFLSRKVVDYFPACIGYQNHSTVIFLFIILSGYYILVARDKVSVSVEEKEPFITRPEQRPKQYPFYPLSVRIDIAKSIGSIRNGRVTLVEITRHMFGGKDEHSLNGNVPINIGWFGGINPFKPHDITPGEFWPVFVITNDNKTISIFCDKTTQIECGSIQNLRNGSYSVKIRISGDEIESVEKSIRFDWFGDVRLLKIKMDDKSS